MARQPRGIRPSRYQERLFERDLRREFLNPMFSRLQGGLARVSAIEQAWRVLDDVVKAMDALPNGGVPVSAIQRNLNAIQGYHRERLIQSFSSALGADIRPFLTDADIQVFMRARIGASVDLIRTIPSRMHADLLARMQKGFAKSPFDMQHMRGFVQQEFKSSGYNLRRIVRDQTGKAIGGLTEKRHGQLGVEEYDWSSSADERVRPTHAANDGQRFKWSEPPEGTGHPGTDIQCRCAGLAVITPATKSRLTQR